MSEQDMTGGWTGLFSYPAGEGPTTPFMAQIRDRSGVLTGHIIEPNTMGFSSDHLESHIRGFRQGRSVDFTKTYDGASDAAHAVDYSGMLSDDGLVVTGVWSLADLDGTFEMRRERQEGAEQEAGSEAERTTEQVDQVGSTSP